eukprot:5587337-Pyramimonas_sp.AAC.1
MGPLRLLRRGRLGRGLLLGGASGGGPEGLDPQVLVEKVLDALRGALREQSGLGGGLAVALEPHAVPDGAFVLRHGRRVVERVHARHVAGGDRPLRAAPPL